MKPKTLIVTIIILITSVIPIAGVLAQDSVPPPYAGLKNPFPWDDTGAQSAGKRVYQQFCLGCHGVNGSGLSSSDFSARDYPQRLESAPDLYYWILSEGKMDSGMPSFKSSLSEQQRWQVLTYIWYLGNAPVTPPTSQRPEAGFIQINAVKQIEAGRTLVMSAILFDKVGKPIQGETVFFSTRENFFATGLMVIGQATTDDRGIARFEYIPQRAESTELIASYGDVQSSTTAIVTETDMQFYQSEAGLRLPSAGPKVFIGPQTATEPTVGQAPSSAVRLPGGLFSWLWLLVFALLLIWSVYFRVMYQVLHIPASPGIEGQNLRLVPRISLIIIVVLCLLMVLMIITGPYSHFHLQPY
jgi:mono/diheme cytochrome c family protein